MDNRACIEWAPDKVPRFPKETRDISELTRAREKLGNYRTSAKLLLVMPLMQPASNNHRLSLTSLENLVDT